MNGYELSRKWFDWSFNNPEKIKPVHTAIYFFAIEHCNRLGWKEKFGLPTTMVKEAIGVKSYNTYINALNDLVEWGFIRMVEKSKNQHSANIVALSNFNKAIDKALDKAMIKHTSKQSESTSESNSSVDKPITSNLKPINKEQRAYSQAVHNCLLSCLNSFPNHLHPKDQNTWLDTIEKLNRIEKIDFSLIEQVVQKTRADDFWSGNFLSLTKLRKKNKDGIMYIVVFNEQTKKNNNGKPNPNETAAERVARIYKARVERQSNNL